MGEKFDIGKFVHKDGPDIGRLKDDSPEAEEITRKAADQENEIRGEREKSRKYMKGEREGLEVFGGRVPSYITDETINESTDKFVKKELGYEGIAKLGPAIDDEYKGVGNAAKAKAVMREKREIAEKIHEEYDDIQSRNPNQKLPDASDVAPRSPRRTFANNFTGKGKKK